MRVLFQPQFGSVNALLTAIGLPAQPWMASPKSALLTVALVAAWARLGIQCDPFPGRPGPNSLRAARFRPG